MAEPNNKEEYILNSDWEELIDQTDITPLVTMTDENTPEYTVTINQPEGATITVALLSGETKTETFTTKQGTVYNVSISGDNASKLILNTNGGKVLGDITIEARDYSKDDNPNYCSIIILQEHAEDQVIYCHLTNPDGTEDTTEYRNSLWVQPGSKCDFTLETNFVRKWDLGKLNVETIDPVTKNVNYVYATPPVMRDDFDPTICVVTIIQVPHMTIHVWVTAPGETTEVEHTESFNAKIGSTYRITTTMESDWYEGGRVLYPTTGTFNLDCTITGVSPELVMFTVHIIQTAHQTITVNCNGANYTTDFTARKNSIWKATIVGETNRWDPGDISPQTNGSLVSDIWITASPATFLPQIMQINFWKMTDRGPYASFWGADDNAASDKYTDHGWFQDWYPMRTFCYRNKSENLIINMADSNRNEYLNSTTTYIYMSPWYVTPDAYNTGSATKYEQAIFKFPSASRTNFRGWEEATDGYGIDPTVITMILDGQEYPPTTSKYNCVSYRALRGLVYCWNHRIIQFDCDIKFE